MPAEWEPHEATWLSWPRPDGISFPSAYQEIRPIFRAMVEALGESEEVRINCGTPELRELAKKTLQGLSNFRFFDIPTNEPWCRDHGPIFTTRPSADGLAAVNWQYNAWGGKYPPYDEDNRVPERIAAALKLPLFDGGMVLEGGSIEVNGAGTLLTTEQCLLHPNRNPSLSRQEIETKLCAFLGVEQVLWLGDGVEGDDTDGHIDDLTRFVDVSTVVTMIEDNTGDPNHAPLQENLKRLKAARLPDGRPLEILTLRMPAPVTREGARLPASYANFYIANKVILLPVFNDPNDARAVEVIAGCFPERRVIPIDCRSLVWGLGAFHCLTQQQPAASV